MKNKIKSLYEVDPQSEFDQHLQGIQISTVLKLRVELERSEELHYKAVSGEGHMVEKIIMVSRREINLNWVIKASLKS